MDSNGEGRSHTLAYFVPSSAAACMISLRLPASSLDSTREPIKPSNVRPEVALRQQRNAHTRPRHDPRAAISPPTAPHPWSTSPEPNASTSTGVTQRKLNSIQRASTTSWDTSESSRRAFERKMERLQNSSRTCLPVRNWGIPPVKVQDGHQGVPEYQQHVFLREEHALILTTAEIWGPSRRPRM